MKATQPQYPDITRYDTYPKLLAYNAKHWPDEVAMREKAVSYTHLTLPTSDLV